MLHLQMAANLAKILGIKPSYAWTYFGKYKNDEGEMVHHTTIPYILDLQDTVAILFFKSYHRTHF